MLQMGRLMCPFDVEVEIDTELDDMAEDVTVMQFIFLHFFQ